MRTALLTMLLTAALAAPVLDAGAAKRVKRQPAQVEADRFTVVADRRPDRLPEIARRLLAVDLFLTRHLGVPAERLAEPVTLAYLHRTSRMDRRLPFRGDHIGHMHLLPTDTRLWLLVAEETGLEDLRWATIQVAELALERGPGELPTWLRNGLFELVARLDVGDGDLVLWPATFPTLHGAGVQRAPLAVVAENGWSRYQEPQRWYTSQLAVAYLFDQGRLAEALDPDFDLVQAVADADFDTWVDRAVVSTTTEPRVIEIDAFPVTTALDPRAVTEEELLELTTGMTLTHRKGTKAFRLSPDDVNPYTAAWMELREDAPGSACGALVTDNTPEGLYLQGLCLWRSAPAAAEEAFRRAGRSGIARGSLHAAAMVLATPGREADAAALILDARAAAPDDPDAAILDALIQARAGECPAEPEPDAGDTAWSTIRYVPGPVENGKTGYVLEILRCGS